jgi:hypothetical protein
MPEQLSSFLVAVVFFGLLVVIRVQVFQLRAATQKRQFCPGSSMHLLLHVFASLAVPGLGQAMRGRTSAAFAHLGIFAIALAFVGVTAFFFNLVSAMEHVFN